MRKYLQKGSFLIKSVFFLALLVAGFKTTLAQAPAVAYPTAASALTRALGSGSLTVKVGFTVACPNTTVTIGLAPSVTYVPGSITVTANNGVVFTASENDISNLNRPTFNLNGVTGAGDVTFTITRRAGCGSAASGKDTVIVIGSCGTVREDDANTNTYNISQPTLSITPAAPMNNTTVGATATRQTTVINGGNGCLDTLRFYTVYPAGGIINTNNNKITVGGIDFSPWRTNGDTLFYKIFGATIFGGDNILCNGESIVVNEPIKIVKCNTTTTYAAYWAPNATSSACQTAQATSSISMANGVPNLTFSFTRVSTGDFCTGDTWRYTITNNGSQAIANAGAAYNIKPLLGTHIWYTPNDAVMWASFATLNNFNVNGVSLTATGTGSQGKRVDLGQLTADPDGAGGLADLDGDGQFDDLPVGASFVLDYKLQWICSNFPTVCGQWNDITPNARVDYTDQCSNAKNNFVQNPQNNLRYASNNTATAASSGPPDVLNGSTFTANFCFSSASENAWPSPTTNLLELVITLPAGVQLASTPNANYSLDGATATAVTITSSGSTVTIRVPYQQGRHSFCFNINLMANADCSVSSQVNPQINYQFNHINNPACASCVWKLPCGSYSLHIGCPCVNIGGVNNPVGTATRTTIGWTNASLTTKASISSLTAKQLKTVLPLDSFNVNITSTQSSQAVYNNLYLQFSFEMASGNASYFDYGVGTVLIKKGGSSPSYTVTLPVPTITNDVANQNIIWTFDISSLIGSQLPGGFTFDPTDTYEANFKTVYNGTNTPGGSITQLKRSKLFFYNIDNTNTKIYCGDYGIELYLLPLSQTGAFTTDGSLSSCNGGNLGLFDHYATLGVFDQFPNEFRPSRYVDSIKIVLPQGVKYDFSRTAVIGTMDDKDVWSPDSPISIPTVNGNTITFVNPGNWKLGDVNSSSTSRVYSFSIPVIGSCEVASGSSSITYTQTLYYRNNYYAYNLAPVPALPPAGVPTGNLTSSNTTTYVNKPSLTIANNTGTVQGIKPQHYWDVQVNSNGTATAPYVWFALEKGTGTGNISIDSVVLKPSNQVLVPDGIYNGNNAWFKYSATGMISGQTQNARIYFKYSSCTKDSILFKAGWNCSGYPTPDPSTYTCTPPSTYLVVDPLPSNIQLSMLRQSGNGNSIDLCTTDSILVVVNSAQSAYLINPIVDVVVPTGVTLQSPISVEYPLASGNYQIVSPVNIGSGVYQISLSGHSAIGTTGIPGTVSQPTAPPRQAKIKIPFTTDCTISSGSSMQLIAHGTMPCTAPAQGDGASLRTSGINITGATTTGNISLKINTIAPTLNCGQTTTISLTATPVLSATASNDTAIYTLPSGVEYVAGSFAGGSNCSTCTLITETAGGNNNIKVALPSGVLEGQDIQYSFGVRAVAADVSCGKYPILANVKRTIPPLLCSGNACPNSSLIIGTIASNDTLLISKPDPIITNYQTLNFNWAPGSTNVPVSVTVKNNSSIPMAAATYYIEFFCGSSTTPFYSALFPNAVGANATVTANMTIDVSSSCPAYSTMKAVLRRVTASNGIQCMCGISSSATAITTLPVQLISFDASAKDCKVNLTWSTGTEENFDYFDIEHSTDGNNFVSIGKANAKGSSSNYSFIDNLTNSKADNYYRLRIVDKYGKPDYSAIKRVNTTCESAISIRPNPTNGIAQIYGLELGQEVLVLNSLGQIVIKSKVTKTNEIVNLTNFANGLYQIVIAKNHKQIYKSSIIKK